MLGAVPFLSLGHLLICEAEKLCCSQHIALEPDSVYLTSLGFGYKIRRGPIRASQDCSKI